MSKRKPPKSTLQISWSVPRFVISEEALAKTPRDRLYDVTVAVISIRGEKTEKSVKVAIAKNWNDNRPKFKSAMRIAVTGKDEPLSKRQEAELGRTALATMRHTRQMAHAWLGSNEVHQMWIKASDQHKEMEAGTIIAAAFTNDHVQRFFSEEQIISSWREWRDRYLIEKIHKS